MPRHHNPIDVATDHEKSNTDPANPDHPIGGNGEFYFSTSEENSIGIDSHALTVKLDHSMGADQG